mgnify:CR=1 FL=1
MERYIEFFNGYRNAYGVADFNHQDSKVDSETGKKKPVYRWNFEELTNDIYQQHIKGELSIGIQPCTEDSEVKFGVIDIDPKDYASFSKKGFLVVSNRTGASAFNLIDCESNNTGDTEFTMNATLSVGVEGTATDDGATTTGRTGTSRW